MAKDGLVIKWIHLDKKSILIIKVNEIIGNDNINYYFIHP